MNSDFPRIITLLRKEHNISQKQAASDLGVSQALLSHYEKGIRECGLDFLVRAADYYNVSCDYLLGRSPEPSGNRLAKYENKEPAEGSAEEAIIRGASGTVLRLAEKSGSRTLFGSVYSYLLLAVYKCFRRVYLADPANDKRMFSLPFDAADLLTNSVMSLNEAEAAAAAEGRPINGGDKVKNTSQLTTSSITGDYADGSYLLADVKQAEDIISKKLNIK